MRFTENVYPFIYFGVEQLLQPNKIQHLKKESKKRKEKNKFGWYETKTTHELKTKHKIIYLQNTLECENRITHLSTFTND